MSGAAMDVATFVDGATDDRNPPNDAVQLATIAIVTQHMIYL
jgi:hypothetical protein